MRPSIVMTPGQWIFSVCLVLVMVFAFAWMCHLLKMGADAAQEWADKEKERVDEEESEINKTLNNDGKQQ